MVQFRSRPLRLFDFDSKRDNMRIIQLFIKCYSILLLIILLFIITFVITSPLEGIRLVSIGSGAVSSSMTKGESSRSSLSTALIETAISSFCSHGDEVFLLDVSLSLVTEITSVSFFDKSKGCSIIVEFSGSTKGTRAGGIFDSLRSLAREF